MSNISPAVVEAIRTAIQMEKEGQHFYEECARKTENELGKKMFESIAKDEIGHLHTFQKMFDTLTGTDQWKELAQGSPNVGKVPIFEGRTDKKRDVNQSDIDALRIGMESERKGIELYKKAAEDAKEPIARQIFTKIREEEEYHYDLLQAQLDYLTKSGFWLDVAEFRMDGKY